MFVRTLVVLAESSVAPEPLVADAFVQSAGRFVDALSVASALRVRLAVT